VFGQARFGQARFGQVRVTALVVSCCVLAVSVVGCASGKATSKQSPLTATSSSSVAVTAGSATALSGNGSSGSAAGPSSSTAQSVATQQANAAAASAAAKAAAAATPTSTSCPFAKVSDVGAAMGGKVGSVTGAGTVASIQSCTFVLSASNVHAAGTVRITVITSATSELFDNIMRGAGASTAVSGVGQKAFYLASVETLTLFKSSKITTIQAHFDHDAGAQSPSVVQSDLTSLGKAVAAQL